jgi:signal transduction histidine kinase
VEPISRITDTAGAIAGGSYGIQIEKHYDDEIGDLIDSINNMSSKISQTEKMKSEFISSISHELRTPLTAINGWSETLLAGEFAEDRESTQKGLSIIASEGKRLSKMVEELLEFSRIEDGRFTLNIELVDIQAEFEDAIFTYRQFYKKKGIELEYKDKAGVLDPIPGDPERLRQVFSNVLDNAAKHGGEKQLIQARLGVEGDMVVIQIRDHGPGVQEKDLPHVKEMFYKASSKVRGNGIGLAVCDEIISRHGGTLTIANAKGGGCAVTIRLPMESPTAV